jgi:integrase
MHVRLIDGWAELRRMSSGTAEELQRLLEEILETLTDAVKAEALARKGTRQTMLQRLDAGTRIDVRDEARANLPRLLRRVQEAEAAAGQTARAAAVAGALDPAALNQLQELLGSLGVRSAAVPTPTAEVFLRDTYTAERRLREDAHRHVVGYVSLFVRVAGDRPLADYRRNDVIKWIRVLEGLRTSYGKRKGDDTKTIQQLLKSSEGEKTLNRTTIEKHLIHLKAFFVAGNRHHRWTSIDEIDALFRDIPLSRHVPDARPRKSWTTAHLGGLLASPIWSGTRSRRDAVTRRHEPGPQIHRDAYWWLPIAALWTGARLEELAQLQHDDLAHDRDGTAYLRIHDDGDRKVKTAHSVRNVPVHRCLRDLGFTDLFRTGGRGRIWPELKPHGRPPSWGALYSTHFTDYRRACGLYEPLRDFHSLRRTFVTMLRTRADVDALTVAAIVGHDDSDPELRRVQQTNDYTDYSIASLAAAVERLDYAAYGLDLSILARTAAVCGPRESTRTEYLPP